MNVELPKLEIAAKAGSTVDLEKLQVRIDELMEQPNTLENDQKLAFLQNFLSRKLSING